MKHEFGRSCCICATVLCALVARGGSALAQAEPDVVESIGEASQGPTELAPALPPPQRSEPSTDRFELHGWARQSLEVGLAGELWRPTALPDAYTVPYDAVIARTQLLMRARYARAKWFEANISGWLGYSVLEQRPAGAEPFNGINGRAVRGVLDPQLRELYIGLFCGPMDIRIGQQRIAWGRTEFLSPNDVLNARDARDPWVGERELRALPTPSARIDIDLGFGSLQGVFSPVFVPGLFDAFGSNWAGVQPVTPAPIRGFFGLLQNRVDPTVTEPVKRVLEATRLPRMDFSQPNVGAKFTWTAGDFDFSHYYHFGFDGPFVQLDPRVSAALAATDFNVAGLTSITPLLAMWDRGAEPISVTYVRRHHIGFDGATLIGPFALRVDVAYDSRRVFYRTDLRSFTNPTVQGNLALEYQSGDPNKLLLFEAMYMRLLEETRDPMLIWSPNSAGIGALIRWPLFGPCHFELLTLIGLMPRTELVQPQVDLKFDDWVISIGGLWLQGAPTSFGGYFSRNREAYAKLRVSF